MIKSLRRKFVLITMALVSVILLAVFFGITIFYVSNLRSESHAALMAALDRRDGERPPNFQIGGNMPDGAGRDPVFVVEVMAGGSARLVYSEGIDVGDDEMQAVTALVLEAGAQSGELSGYNLRYQVGGKGGITKIAFTDLTLERAQIGSMLLVTGLSVAGALLVFLFASLFLARWVLKPVQQAWQRQRRFVADASHELKTPLTVILANTGILKNHKQATVESQMAWVDNTEQEARRMKGLVDDLLFLAKGDDAAEVVPLTPVDLSDAATTTALAFEPVAYEQGIALDMDIEPALTVLGNSAQLKQLVEILLDNAVKYAAPKTAVWLQLKAHAGQAQLAVHNKGQPISAEEQKHLFERFYRADPSRAKEGYGLGLSIAQAITESHHGKIEASSNAHNTVFTVCIPLE